MTETQPNIIIILMVLETEGLFPEQGNGERLRLISETRQLCESLLETKGSRVKRNLTGRLLMALGSASIFFSKKEDLREVLSYTGQIRVRKRDISIRISSNRTDPSQAELIRVQPIGWMVELALVKRGDGSDDALIFQDFGMRERIGKIVTEQDSEATEQDSEKERVYTNPRPASTEDISPYRNAVAKLK